MHPRIPPHPTPLSKAMPYPAPRPSLPSYLFISFLPSYLLTSAQYLAPLRPEISYAPSNSSPPYAPIQRLALLPPPTQPRPAIVPPSTLLLPTAKRGGFGNAVVSGFRRKRPLPPPCRPSCPCYTLPLPLRSLTLPYVPPPISYSKKILQEAIT